MSKLIAGLMALSVVGGVFSIILNFILAGLLALTYTSLTQEELVVTMTFSKEEKQQNVYEAHLYDASGSKLDDYTIYGDQWRIDAGFIKMEYWANILGVDSKYILNRFEGRYKNIEDENNKKHKAYELESHSLIENFDFFFDTTYGSSVYQDIELNTKYSVFKTQTGLMVREEFIEPIKKEKSLFDKTKSLFGFK